MATNIFSQDALRSIFIFLEECFSFLFLFFPAPTFRVIEIFGAKQNVVQCDIQQDGEPTMSQFIECKHGLWGWVKCTKAHSHMELSIRFLTAPHALACLTFHKTIRAHLCVTRNNSDEMETKALEAFSSLPITERDANKRLGSSARCGTKVSGEISFHNASSPYSNGIIRWNEMKLGGKGVLSRLKDGTLFAWFILVLWWHLRWRPRSVSENEIMKHLITVITNFSRASSCSRKESSCVHLTQQKKMWEKMIFWCASLGNDAATYFDDFLTLIEEILASLLTSRFLAHWDWIST